jgi:hypothetical protein
MRWRKKSARWRPRSWSRRSSSASFRFGRLILEMTAKVQRAAEEAERGKDGVEKQRKLAYREELQQQIVSAEEKRRRDRQEFLEVCLGGGLV